MLPFLRHIQDERHVEATVVRPPFAARHAGAVVAVVKDDRVFRQTGLGQLLEISPGAFVHHGDAIVVLRPILAHFGRVRMIRRHAYLFGIMNGKLRINLVSDLAFVANGMIEDRKKRLIAGAVFPMRLAATLIPHLPFLAEIVVFLGIVGAVIPGLTQVIGVHLESRRQTGIAAHVLGARARRIQSADQGGTSRRAHRRSGPAIQIKHPLRRQRIQVG